MIKYFKDLKNTPEEKCCGGEGQTNIYRIVTPDEVYADMPTYALVYLSENDTVGYHIHSDDMEMYTILKGEAIYNDNGTEVILHPGDTSITYAGEGHSIKPAPGQKLEFLACILKK